MMFFFQLILAHLIGDFFLQSKSSIAQKNELKWAAPQLYIHIAIHFVLIVLLAGLDAWPIALVLTVLHYIIDGCKLQFQNKQNKQALFFVDQALHLLSIIAAVIYVKGIPEINFTQNGVVCIAIILFLTRPASFFVAQAMSHWNAKIIGDEESEKSLPNAGQFIGIIERLLIFAFILVGHWGAIGFLMAAKSIFRFGDLTRAKDRRLTEYILIGTFMSFAVAIACGIFYMHLF